VVHDVEHLVTKLYVLSLLEAEVLEHRHVDEMLNRTVQDIASRIAEAEGRESVRA
jgi:hypothetical protein